MKCPNCGKTNFRYGIFVWPHESGDQKVEGWLCLDEGCYSFYPEGNDEVWAAQADDR